MSKHEQKTIDLVPISPPPKDQRVSRNADFAGDGRKKDRYSLPDLIQSSSPVGYRTRVSLTQSEATQALQLLSLERPTAFAPGSAPTEQQLFEEISLGILSSRQSTNFSGHREVLLGPDDSARAASILSSCNSLDAAVLEHATHTHVVLSRPYRTAFTLLLTFIGHQPLKSLLTVPLRAAKKRFLHVSDIPTIDYLQHMHLGILADAMERAAVIASSGRQRAQVHSLPFCESESRRNRRQIRELEALCGLTPKERSQGWRVAMVTQVGDAIPEEQVALSAELSRKLGANLLAFRSERIQPGVNHEEKAPAPYRQRQDMDVPDELTVMAGRAAYNAFSHWTGCDRERSKDLLILDRIDVLTPNGKERLRRIRDELGEIADLIMKRMPLWADLPTGKALSRNAKRGKKAFALAGQRIYIA
ncbi:MAG: hypothetical protein KC561_03960, partial [Myxococcales bacterium]|nr:hypothetical protein [Myxococcales bacterium]